MSAPTPPDGWLTTNGAAELLGVHPRSVRKLVQAGMPHRVRAVGKREYKEYQPEAIADWWAKHRTPAQSHGGPRGVSDRRLGFARAEPPAEPGLPGAGVPGVPGVPGAQREGERLELLDGARLKELETVEKIRALRIDNAVKEGRLVDKDDVQRELGARVRALAERLDAAPARLADRVRSGEDCETAAQEEIGRAIEPILGDLG